MSISTRIVRITAGTLPKSLRDRYREQWLADVRDAPEQNLRPAQIALGTVAFAVTVGRPFPKPRELTPAEVDRRVRIARGLAVSAAVLGLSQWASMFAGEYVGDGRVPDAPTVVMSTSLIAYAVLASAVALILVLVTRRVSTRTRWAVALFAVASASPIVQSSLSAAGNASWEPALHASAIPYLAAAIPVVVGRALLRTPPRIAGHSPRASIAAGAVCSPGRRRDARERDDPLVSSSAAAFWGRTAQREQSDLRAVAAIQDAGRGPDDQRFRLVGRRRYRLRDGDHRRGSRGTSCAAPNAASDHRRDRCSPHRRRWPARFPSGCGVRHRAARRDLPGAMAGQARAPGRHPVRCTCARAGCRVR